MSPVLHEHPFASYCWKVLIALYERDVPFERRLVADAADRDRLAQLWPPAGIPVLVDAEADVVLPESTVIIDHLDGVGDAPPLVPPDGAAATQARLWDRVCDAQVMTPVQKIVGDELRPADARDPHGVAEARAQLDRAYTLLDDRLASGDGWLAGPSFTLADCAAAASLFYAWVLQPWDEARHPRLTAYFGNLMARPSVARVVDEARPWRHLFPLPWPAHAA